MQVLIVDDDRIAREMLQRQLTSQGYDVTAVADGEQAWELFQSEPFSIVITDWVMPGMDGPELLKRIRKAASQYVYCILLTVKWQVDAIVAGMEAGADDFLTKPFDPNELRVRMAAGQRIIQLERQLSESNRRMKKELNAAASIQRALLPSATPDIEGGRFAWTYQPCDELGGDILNVIPLSVDEVAIYLLDVSGHGVSAALLSVALSRILTTATNASSAIRDLGDEPGKYIVVEPSAVLTRLNERFAGDLEGGRFFTILYGVLNLKTLSFRYASGGHNPAVWVSREGEVRTLNSTGTVVGIIENAAYQQDTVELQPGDRLFIYSDGLTEARNVDEEYFGIERVISCVCENAGGSLQEMLDDVFQRLNAWVDPHDLDDDVSCLVAETTFDS